MNWFLTIVIKAVLEWLTSLLVRLKRNEELKQQGRQEVKDALDQKKQEVDREIEVIRNTDTSFDAAIDELRKRSGGSTDVLSGNKTSTP